MNLQGKLKKMLHKAIKVATIIGNVDEKDKSADIKKYILRCKKAGGLQCAAVQMFK